MDLIKDMYYVNKVTFNKTLNLFINNWTIVLTGFVYTFLNTILMFLVGIIFMVPVLGFFSGIIMAVVMSAMISNYLYLLYNIIKYGKFTFEEFKTGFKVYIWRIYGIIFIIWIASFLFNRTIAPVLYRILPPGLFGLLSTLISLLIFILLNALPESIYQKFYSPWETITYAFNFIKENWIEWFIPNALFIFIIYIIAGRIILNIFSLRLNLSLVASLPGVLSYIIGQVLFSVFMIYRGILFDILSTSTRRKRFFMRDLYK